MFTEIPKSRTKLRFFSQYSQRMHRQRLLHLLHQHQSESRTSADAHEAAMTRATIAFVERHPDCFERSLLAGHVTGSAWIVSPNRDQVVLIHHRKLDRWFQPGGHADGDPDVAAVALREAQEETGLTSLRFVGESKGGSWLEQTDQPPALFDVDVHTIPARGDIPEHLHYDIRFLLEANPTEPFGHSDEVENSRWVLVDRTNEYSNEESIHRMVRKTLRIRQT